MEFSKHSKQTETLILLELELDKDTNALSSIKHWNVGRLSKTSCDKQSLTEEDIYPKVYST